MNLEFNKNEDVFKQLTFQLSEKLKKVKLGGGEKKIAAQHKRNNSCIYEQ